MLLILQKKEASKTVNQAIEKEEKDSLDKIRSQGRGESREWYKFIRGNKGNGNKDGNSLKIEGKIISDPEVIKGEVEKFWRNIGGPDIGNFRHVCDMELNMRRITEEMNIRRPTIDEIRKTVNKLKNNKGVGFDGIPYEFFKNGGEGMVRALYELYGKIWEEESVPRKWNESRVILLHKGGHKSKMLLQNFRPISLGNTIGKVFSYILNERMKKVCEQNGMYGEEQNGFRTDRRGEDNIFIIREIIEKQNREKNNYI